MSAYIYLKNLIWKSSKGHSVIERIYIIEKKNSTVSLPVINRLIISSESCGCGCVCDYTISITMLGNYDITNYKS